MAGAAVPKYLAGSPKGFAHSCDILLKLDDGSEVPAHSQVLARYSKVFSDMLEEDGPLNRASGTSKVIVPINECSKDEAIQWLCVVYSFAPTSLIGEATGLSTARLAHKYGMKEVLDACDNVLSRLAGISSKGSESYLQGKDVPFVLQTLDTALKLGMPRLAACCEHRIATEPTQGFSLQSISEHVPFNSLVRIAEALRGACESVFKETNCYGRYVSHAGPQAIMQHAPGPSDFYRWNATTDAAERSAKRQKVAASS